MAAETTATTTPSATTPDGSDPTLQGTQPGPARSGQPIGQFPPPLIETPNPNEAGPQRNPGDPSISLNPDGTPATKSVGYIGTVPPNAAPMRTSDPAFVPSPFQQLPTSFQGDEEMDNDKGFLDFYNANIFTAPGSHAGDHAFKVWLYSIYKGRSTSPGVSPQTPTAAATTSPGGIPITNTTSGSPPPTPEATSQEAPGTGVSTEPAPAGTPAPAATPNITSVSPDNAFANHDLDLLVMGSGFDPNAKIVFDGTEVTSTVNDQNTIKATIPAASMPNPSTFNVSVKNSDGTESNKVTFTAT
jgi:hypothetical protein